MEKRAAIIGAGLGGLAASVRLAKAGFEIDVYEQNDSPGGKAGSFTDSGFRFDTGPSLITLPFIIKDLFEYAGENIDNYLQLNKLETLCKYFWNDGTVVNAYSDLKKFSTEIQRITSDKSAAVLNYMDYCRNIYELTADIFLFNNPKEIKSYFNISAFKTLLKLNQIDSFRSMHKANSSFFKDKKTIQLFDRYATYSGSNPFLSPATLNLIQHVEYNLGGYFTKGGMYSLIKAIFNLAVRSGVRFFFKSKVQSISLEGKKISGIKVQDEFKKYNIVISNTDYVSTHKNLIMFEKIPDKNNLSSSAIVFYWGVKGNYSFLETHNILFSEDYKKEFDDIFISRKSPEDPTIYIYISSKLNPSDAPENCENWYVMINTSSIEKQDWEKEIAKSKTNILLKIKNILGIDITEKIIAEKILTPAILEAKTGAYKGSIYGLSSNSIFSAFSRYPNKSSKFKGLYFCGGTVHPGGGIPLVLLSGKNAANAVIKDYDKS